MIRPGLPRPAALLAAAVLLAWPAGSGAQEAAPLVKSEVVRLLVSDTYAPEERREIVRRSCLTFTPSEADMEDFRRLGAGPGLLEVIRACVDEGRTTAERVRVPEPPGEVEVPAPDVEEGAAGQATPPASGMAFATGLREYRVRPPPPAADRGNLLARVEVPPRLLNPAEVQRRLRRTAPDAAFETGDAPRCVLWVFVDATGSVREARVGASSGLEAFDRAALEAARVMAFEPGSSGARPVGMWVQQTLSLRG